MKIQSVIWGFAAAGCALTIACPTQASAAVSVEDFNALKNLVTEQGQKIEQLEKTNALDRQQIQQLQQQLGQTQTVATNAEQKVETLSQIQPTYPLPNPTAGATHNFMIVGDAETQFGKTAAQHSGFALADFAPIFLFRANDNVLFEAGFDTTLQNAGGPPGTGSGTSTTLSLSFAQLDYLLNDYVTVIAGEMLLPLGTYNERNAGWLNKIPDSPLLDDQILPGSGVGAQLRGAVPVGEDGQMLTYSVYGVNGPGSVNGSGSAFQTPGDPTSGPNLDLNSNVGILGDGTRESDDPMLGCRVGAAAALGFLPGGRTGENQPSEAALAHAAHGEARQLERAIEVDAHRLTPDRRILLPHQPLVRRADAVVHDQQLERTETPFGLGNGQCAALGGAEVGHYVLEADRRQLRLAARRDHHARPCSRQQQRSLAPDAAATAGNQRHASVHRARFAWSKTSRTNMTAPRPRTMRIAKLTTQARR